jgi:membrane-associated protease RseP (regulator of RpoE activity)
VTRGGELEIGDVTVDKPLTMFNFDKGGSGAAEAFPGNIGAGILKRFVVTLDYLHYVMYLKPVSGPVADLDAFDRSGMWINGGERGFKIAYVSAGTPAQQAGLKAGDIVAAVDGTPAGELHLYDVRQRLRDDPPGTIVKLEIRRGAENKDISIRLRNLI